MPAEEQLTKHHEKMQRGYHQKDNSPETKLKVIAYYNLTDRKFKKLSKRKTTNYMKINKGS